MEIKRSLRRIKTRFFGNRPDVKIDASLATEFHGSEYGGWTIERESLRSKSTVYSFGIGHDVSFDLSLINRYRCAVHGFDPTPRVVSWVEKQNLDPNFKFHPLALSHEPGHLQFFEPDNPTHISHSKHPSSKSGKPIEVACSNLRTIRTDLGHDSIDLIKMDIEGFEYDVLNETFLDLPIRQLLIEFHHFLPHCSNEMTTRTIDLLRQFGFKLFHISPNYCEYSFINESVNQEANQSTARS
ncbi:hypothetical protein LF1_23590 [Rubripirellula obstinata]|uniref:Methyltransferase FkbM domain-containing protein n=1 Tax=Rubripirellula obstinata TaxID=406547 RepID=A0A5B1CHX3_9BACT|nr:hypothetical protein LF1_23590 [Rubripirellula obstinata]